MKCETSLEERNRRFARTAGSATTGGSVANGVAADVDRLGFPPRSNLEPGCLVNQPDVLKVSTREVGGATHFYVQNLESATVTATFEMQLANLKASARNFPYLATFPANATVESIHTCAREEGRALAV